MTTTVELSLGMLISWSYRLIILMSVTRFNHCTDAGANLHDFVESEVVREPIRPVPKKFQKPNGNRFGTEIKSPWEQIRYHPFSRRENGSTNQPVVQVDEICFKQAQSIKLLRKKRSSSFSFI